MYPEQAVNLAFKLQIAQRSANRATSYASRKAGLRMQAKADRLACRLVVANYQHLVNQASAIAGWTANLPQYRHW